MRNIASCAFFIGKVLALDFFRKYNNIGIYSEIYMKIYDYNTRITKKCRKTAKR